MTSDQNAAFKMMMAVKAVCNAFIALWNGTPSFKIPFTNLVNNVLNVLPQALAQQAQPTTGVTIDKATSRTALETLLLSIAGGVEAYAATVKDASLRKFAHLTPSGLRNLEGPALTGEAERIATLATANLANLGPYNITAARITALRTAATTFSDWIDKPERAIDLKRGGTDLIAELRQTGEGLLDQMDAQMVLFQTTGPDFYQQYFFAREIDDAPTRKRAITFKVKDAEGRPVPDAVVSMLYLPKDKRTGPAGMCYVQYMAPGTYPGKVEKGGYVSHPFVAVVNVGETTLIEVVLVRV